MPSRRSPSAARRAGLKFGVYYSIMDWHHPDAQAPAYPDYNSRTATNPNFGRYVETYMKPQLRELVTQYPEIDVLWFDGEWVADWSDAQGRTLYDWLRGIRPSLIINNRVGHSRQGMAGMSANKDAPGDFGTPEQRVPPEGLPGVDWETCMTLNDTWGFQSFDDGWKDTRTLVRTLIDVASKGGNFLLNVGPTAQGMIPSQSVSRLREMGDWLRVERRVGVRHDREPVRASGVGTLHGEGVGRAGVRPRLRLAEGPAAGAHGSPDEADRGLPARRPQAAHARADGRGLGRAASRRAAERDLVGARAGDGA